MLNKYLVNLVASLGSLKSINQNPAAMTINKKLLGLFFFSVFSTIVVLSSCKKDDDDDDGNTTTVVNSDSLLFALATETSGFTWYKNSEAPLPKSTGSGHVEAFLRTRYNATAAAKLDGSGKVTAGTIFPEGSLIVKELLNDSNTTNLSTYAILYKQSNSADADEDGWVWGYLYGNGNVRISATKKGSDCRSCHSGSGAIDFTLMNQYFP